MQHANLPAFSTRTRLTSTPEPAPGSAAEALPETSSYERYCRPRTGELLRRLRLDRTYHRALGDLLYYRDERGEERSVLDFLGGYGASLFGHNHPELRQLLSRMLDQEVPFNAQMSSRAGAGELAQKLDQLMHAATGKHFVVTLANTGAEAVEAALKHAVLERSRQLDARARELARLRAKLASDGSESGVALDPSCFERAAALLGCARDCDLAEVMAAVEAGFEALRARPPLFLSVQGAFHGKTGAAVQLTYNPRYREAFRGLGPEVRFVRFGDADDLQRALEESQTDYVWPLLQGGVLTLVTERCQRVAALVVEPIQGEGGMRELPAAFLRACRQATSDHGVTLVFDEIQCGMGRTGVFLASSPSGAVADYYLLSKSLGGGSSKISALLVERSRYVADFGVIHSSTFAEDEYSARLATRALELLESDRLLERARSRGAQLALALRGLKERFPLVVEDVTGRGLMLGLRLYSQRESPSNTLRLLSTQGLLGYVVAGYLLHEHGIRVMPTLSDTHVLRIEPSAYISERDCRLLGSSLEALCMVLQHQNAYHLTRFLVSLEQPGVAPEVPSYGPPRLPQAPAPVSCPEVAFVGHLIDASDMSLSDPSLEAYSLPERHRFLDLAWSALGPAVFKRAVVTSATQAEVRLSFIGLCVDSRIIGRKLKERDLEGLRSLVEQALELAEANDCAVLGLGGYTSVISRNGTRLLPHKAALTTGNSLTVAMGLDALLCAARDRGVDLQRACFAALGAAGNIGTVYSQLMSEHVGRVVLIGRPRSDQRLRQVACSIYERALQSIRSHEEQPAGAAHALGGVAARLVSLPLVAQLLGSERSLSDMAAALHDALVRELGPEAPVHTSTELHDLQQADLIVAASNEPLPLIFPRHLGPRPVVICDISVPMDTDVSMRLVRPDVSVIQGGVVQLGDNFDFQIPGIPLEPGTAFACMAETLLLGLANMRGHYSYGPVEPERVKEIRRLAQLHGFRLARPKTEASY